MPAQDDDDDDDDMDRTTINDESNSMCSEATYTIIPCELG